MCVCVCVCDGVRVCGECASANDDGHWLADGAQQDRSGRYQRGQSCTGHCGELYAQYVRYAQTGQDGHLNAAAGKAQIAELNKEIREAELSQAGIQLVCEAHTGLEMAKVDDAAGAAQDALSSSRPQTNSWRALGRCRSTVAP